MLIIKKRQSPIWFWNDSLVVLKVGFPSLIKKWLIKHWHFFGWQLLDFPTAIFSLLFLNVFLLLLSTAIYTFLFESSFLNERINEALCSFFRCNFVLFHCSSLFTVVLYFFVYPYAVFLCLKLNHSFYRRVILFLVLCYIFVYCSVVFLFPAALYLAIYCCVVSLG